MTQKQEPTTSLNIKCWRLLIGLSSLLVAGGAFVWPACSLAQAVAREHISFDSGWRFALGNTDPAKDFGFGTSAFVFGKDGYADGPASPKFDDRAWQVIDLPHDWAVSLPFAERGSTNHGSKAIGLNFPQNSVGWYRKTFNVGEEARGRRISLQFDGVYRDASVWINGHYIGTEPSGYSSFVYDVTDYVAFGMPNVVVVRVDASREEGWFYEGAGIYRHVWLNETSPLHVSQWGTFVTSQLKSGGADLSTQTQVVNDELENHVVAVEQEILDPDGKVVAHRTHDPIGVAAKGTTSIEDDFDIGGAKLWSLDAPYLYTLVTMVVENGAVVDRYEARFGIRTVSFDPEKGFFLNGKPLKIKGLNIHQDAAGVGVAVPDALQTYRLRRLKAMGANAIRTAHNPPAPETLDAADRLGILVLDENRQFGTSVEDLDQLKRMILRDRNHPSVFLWSVGNEEWADEYSEIGAKLTLQTQAFVKSLDPSRRVTLAMSSSNESGNGGASTTDVMGFNYLVQHHIDAYHKNFPNKPSIMTEEGSTFATRGVYVDDRADGYISAYDRPANDKSASIEMGWKNVIERPFVAGMFVWTGFDYRGETTPFGWPSISSQFGMMDTTGLFKDSAYFLKSQWDPTPMVHILPHWNWPGKEGMPIPVWVYSNADTVELFLNGKSLGAQSMPQSGHLEWQVPYQPGVLEARGTSGDRVVSSDQVVTTGPGRKVMLAADRDQIDAGETDVAVITVRVADKDNATVPTAGQDVAFSTKGPVRIIGVGNGDPASHDPDQLAPNYTFIYAHDWDLKLSTPQIAAEDASGGGEGWGNPFAWPYPGLDDARRPLVLIRGHLSIDHFDAGATYSLFGPKLSADQKLFINGKDASALGRMDAKGVQLELDSTYLHGGDNIVVIVASKPKKASLTTADLPLNRGQGLVTLRVLQVAGTYHRKVFNGFAQVLLQSAGKGQAQITATAAGLAPASLDIAVK